MMFRSIRARMPRPQTVALGSLLLGAVLAGTACENDAYSRTKPAQEVGMTIHPSKTNLLAGENATFTVETRNTFGREPRVDWTTSGGQLEMIQNGRAARVTFPQPGTYLVSARLYLNDQLVRTDSTTITVRPVP